jgi:hypothetical protein
MNQLRKNIESVCKSAVDRNHIQTYLQDTWYTRHEPGQVNSFVDWIKNVKHSNPEDDSRIHLSWMLSWTFGVKIISRLPECNRSSSWTVQAISMSKYLPMFAHEWLLLHCGGVMDEKHRRVLPLIWWTCPLDEETLRVCLLSPVGSPPIYLSVCMMKFYVGKKRIVAGCYSGKEQIESLASWGSKYNWIVSSPWVSGTFSGRGAITVLLSAHRFLGLSPPTTF